MDTRSPANKHLKTSLIIFIIFLILSISIFYISRFIYINIFDFLLSRSIEEYSAFIITCISFIIVLVLISYIIYLLDINKSRTDLIVTERLKPLASARDQFKRLFEDAPVPYIILNNKGEIKNLNKASLRFFGVTPEEIISLNLFSLCSKEEKEKADQILTFFQSKSPINKKEFIFETKKGEKRWVQLSIFEMSEYDSKEYSGLVSILDITEQKKLDQAKTEFVSLTSHQMRTPLATNKWYIDMLVSKDIGELNNKQREYINILNEVNNDMIELVDTLLNVSRIEIGKLMVELKSTNVMQISDNILIELSSQISKKKMNIVKEYNNLFTDIKSDPKLLRIVIHNLITNSIKYTPENGKITISFEQKDGKNCIIISDTGLGIPKNQQDKVFTKLFRADNVKDVSSSQSTGLGLYLIKSLVEAMNGTISFKSEENKGTIFIVSI